MDDNYPKLIMVGPQDGTYPRLMMDTDNNFGFVVTTQPIEELDLPIEDLKIEDPGDTGSEPPPGDSGSEPPPGDSGSEPPPGDTGSEPPPDPTPPP
jgi:hypothetical protein